MTCTDCSAAEETKGHWRQYNAPQCVYCAGRLIRQMDTLRTPTAAQIVERKRVALAEAVAWGHTEAEIRALVKNGPFVQPPQVPKGKRK